MKKFLKKIKWLKYLNDFIVSRKTLKSFLKCSLIEKEQLKFYSQFFSKNDLVFDVGANTGSRTKLFLNLNAKVICYEPQPNLFEHLKSYLKQNKKCLIKNLGLGDYRGSQILNISDAHVLSSMSERWINATKDSGRFAQYNWDTKIKVDISTLDIEIARHGMPTYVKIDVEGYELEVLKGLSEPIKFISIEFTAEDTQQSIACMEKLQELGNYQYNFSEGETHFFENDKWFTKKQLLDYLNSKTQNKSNLWGDIFCKLD